MKGALHGKWLSASDDTSGQLDGEFQLERACHISAIDIGKCHQHWSSGPSRPTISYKVQVNKLSFKVNLKRILWPVENYITEGQEMYINPEHATFYPKYALFTVKYLKTGCLKNERISHWLLAIRKY